MGFGFTQAVTDDCLYIQQGDNDQITLLVLIYVDDMGVTGINAGEILWFKNNLADHFEITDLGKLDYILGIQVT
jgi:hypothetical protein